MPQLAIPYELITPRRTITFNGFDNDPTNGYAGNYYRVTSVEGLDFPALRTATQPRAQTDGDLVFDSWRSGRNLGLVGRLVAGTVAGFDTLEENLRDALNSIVRADGTLRWKPRASTVYRRVGACRLFEPLQIGGDPMAKEFRIGLVAGDAYVYSDVLTTVTNTTPTVAFSVSNNGNADSYPIIRVWGNATPTTSFTLANQVSGGSIRVTGLAGYNTAHYVQFDMAARTVTDDAGLNLISKVTYASSEFWALVPGNNLVAVSVVTGGNPTKVDVIYRDVWIGG